MLGWSTTRGRPPSTVLSKAEVDTLHVSLERSCFLSHDGRYLKKSVEDEKIVKPVSLGDEVAPWKSWNLHLSVSRWTCVGSQAVTYRGGVETIFSWPFSSVVLTTLNNPS